MYNVYKSSVVFPSLMRSVPLHVSSHKVIFSNVSEASRGLSAPMPGKRKASSELFMHAASQASHHNSFRANISSKVLTGSLWRNPIWFCLDFSELAKNLRERWSCLITRFHDFNELITVGRTHKRQSSHRPQRFRMDVTVTTTIARGIKPCVCTDIQAIRS